MRKQFITEEEIETLKAELAAEQRYKLNEDDVREIRRRLREGATLIELGDEYGVHRSTIGLIWKGITWKHVK